MRLLHDLHSDIDPLVSHKIELQLNVSLLRFVFCLRRVKFTFAGGGFVLDCIGTLNRGRMSFFLAAWVGIDHFRPIKSRIIIDFIPEVDLRLLQHLKWSSLWQYLTTILDVCGSPGCASIRWLYVTKNSILDSLDLRSAYLTNAMIFFFKLAIIHTKLFPQSSFQNTQTEGNLVKKLHLQSPRSKVWRRILQILPKAVDLLRILIARRCLRVKLVFSQRFKRASNATVIDRPDCCSIAYLQT